MAVHVNPVEVPIGPASTFRSTINDNFTAIANEIDVIYETMVDVRLATEQPTDQKVGDFWFKDLGESSGTESGET